MRKFLLTIFVVLLSAFLSSTSTLASQPFTDVMIRFERMKAGVSPGNVLVQFTTSTALSTEDSLTIELDSRYQSGTHFSPTASSYTTSTTSIPSGTTALAVSGSQASNVSGNTITFPISNLTPSTTYAFYITGGFIVNRAADTYRFVVSTRDAGSTLIDTQNVFIVTVPNDQIAVSGVVPVAATDTSISLSADNSDPIVSQNTAIVYTITYGSQLYSDDAFTIEAEWPNGHIEENGVEVAVSEYVIGSASDAYGGTKPTVDLANRRITWQIPSLPAGISDQTITFTVKTTESYQGSEVIVFPVVARITDPASSGDKIVTKKYQYKTPSSSSGNSTPEPDSASSQVTTAQIATPLTIDSIRIVGRTDSEITLLVTTSVPSTLDLSYGSKASLLDKKIKSLTSTSRHRIVIPNLKAKSTYYAKITAVSGTQQALSDLLVFETGESLADFPSIDGDKLIILHAGNMISSLGPSGNSDHLFLLVEGEPIDVVIFISNASKVRKAESYLRDALVLGISTQDENEPLTGQSTLTQLEPGKFVGKLKLSASDNVQSLIVSIEDTAGNIREYEIARVKALKPLIVLNSDANPIEGARVEVRFYNPRTRLFEEIPSSSTSIRSVYYSDERGRVPLNLSTGKYKATIHSAGYKDLEVEIDLSKESQNPYPTVTLEQLPSYMTFWGKHNLETLDKTRIALEQFFTSLSTSKRLLSLITTATVVLSLLLTCFTVTVRYHIPILKIPFFFLAVIRKLHKDTSGTRSIYGTVTDDVSHYPLSGVEVAIVDRKTHHTIAHVKTNAVGEFFANIPAKTKEISVISAKHGYLVPLFPVFTVESLHHAPIHIYMERVDHTLHTFILHICVKTLKFVLFFFFQVFLVCSFALSLLYARLFGVGEASVFFIPTVICMGIYILWHEQRVKQHVNRV